MTISTFDTEFETDGNEFHERVVQIRRVAKVVKGGRNLHFNAMVVVGDGRGRVGIGLGKGVAVPDAVRNGNAIARRNMVSVPLNGSTIHHTVRTKFGASHVLLKPAQAGAGVIAGGAVRAVMEALGVRDVVAKALGSRNPINVVKATMAGLEQLQGDHTPLSDEIIQAEKVVQMRREAARPDSSSKSRSNDRRKTGSGNSQPNPKQNETNRPAEAEKPAAVVNEDEVATEAEEPPVVVNEDEVAAEAEEPPVVVNEDEVAVKAEEGSATQDNDDGQT